MDHSALMSVVDGPADLNEQPQYVGQRSGTSALRPCFERLALDVLHCAEWDAVDCLAAVKNRHNIRMVQAGSQVHLAFKACPLRRASIGSFEQHLEGHGPLGGLLLGDQN